MSLSLVNIQSASLNRTPRQIREIHLLNAVLASAGFKNFRALDIFIAFVNIVSHKESIKMQKVYSNCITFFQNQNVILKSEQICDYVIRLKTLSDNKNSLFNDYNGLLNIAKLPSLNTIAFHVPESIEWGYKIRKQKLIIEVCFFSFFSVSCMYSTYFRLRLKFIVKLEKIKKVYYQNEQVKKSWLDKKIK